MRPFGRTDFDAAFTPGTVFLCPKRGRIRVEQVDIGDLVLPSGRVVACDPALLGWPSYTVPFARLAPSDKHPVTLSLSAEGEGAQRVACAMVRFTEAKPVAWEMAVRPGQDASKLPVGKFFGYCVEGGLGCFIDSEVVKTFSKQQAWDFYKERVLSELDKDSEYRAWTNVVVDASSGTNLIVFSSGYGDGSYASYWGIDNAGFPCCLVTDFEILVESLAGKATFTLHDWIGRPISHPDLANIGLTVRVRRSGILSGRRLRLQFEGGKCQAVIMNAGKEYSSNFLSYHCAPSGIGTYDFRFRESLRRDAQITLEYDMGVQALEYVSE